MEIDALGDKKVRGKDTGLWIRAGRRGVGGRVVRGSCAEAAAAGKEIRAAATFA